METLAQCGVKLIAMRCAGCARPRRAPRCACPRSCCAFSGSCLTRPSADSAADDRVDIAACKKHGIRVVRVPAYSPNAVAEQAVGIAMCLARSYHICYNRVREGNFTLNGLERFDIHGKTVGIIGTGKIGLIAAQIFKGFGTRILAYDKFPNVDEMKRIGGDYVSMEELMAQADIVSLHCPMLADTYHLINKERIAQMKDGVMLINVSRGGLIDTPALIDGLESGKVGSCGMDVYENEGQLFFKDLSAMARTKRLKYNDTNIARLMAMPNVLVRLCSLALVPGASAAAPRPPARV